MFNKNLNIKKTDVGIIIDDIDDYFNDLSCFQHFKEGKSWDEFQQFLSQNPILFSKERNQVLDIIQSIAKLSFADSKWLCYSLFNGNYFAKFTSRHVLGKSLKKNLFYFLFLDTIFSLLTNSKSRKINNIFFDEMSNYDHLISLFEEELFDIVESNMLKDYFDSLARKTFLMFQNYSYTKNTTFEVDILANLHHIFEKNFLNKFNTYCNLWVCYFSFSNDDYLSYFYKKLDKNIFPKDDNELPSSKDLVRTKSFFEKSQKYKFEINEFLHFDNFKIIKDAMNHLFYHFDFSSPHYESFYCFSDKNFVKKFKQHYGQDTILFFKQIIYSDILDFLTKFEDDEKNWTSFFIKNNSKIYFSNYKKVFFKSIKNFYLNYEQLREHFYFTNSLLNLFKLKSCDEDRIISFIHLFEIFDFDKELNKNLDDILYFNHHKDLTHIEINFETLLFVVFYYADEKIASRLVSKSTLDKFLNVMENYLDFSFNFYLSEVFSDEDIDCHFSQISCLTDKKIFLHNSADYNFSVNYNSELLRDLLSYDKIFKKDIATINVVLYDCFNYLKYNTKDLREVKNIFNKLISILNYWVMNDVALLHYDVVNKKYFFKNIHFESLLSLIVKLNYLFNIKLHSKNAFLFIFHHLFTRNNQSFSEQGFDIFTKHLSLLAFKDEKIMFNAENMMIIDFLSNYPSFTLIKDFNFDINKHKKIDKHLENYKKRSPFSVYNFIRNMCFELRLNFFD